MHEEVRPGLYRVELPLPKTPLKSVNVYLVRDDARWLMIDTGMHRDSCREPLDAAIEELGVDLENTDFFITHFHSDHIGQLFRLATPESKVYFNPVEAPFVSKAKERGGFEKQIYDLARMTGFSDEDLASGLFTKHPGTEWKGPPHVDFELLDEGDTLTVGDYNFQVIQTPGHSPGHLCLFDAATHLMISGDHVLGDISPNISPWGYDDDPLGDFLASLDRVQEYDVELALPGHRSLIHDFSGRIDELKKHHDLRLDEVRQAVNGTSLTGYDIASQMTWDMRYDKWEEVDIMQRWFASNEAVSHLRLLEARDEIESHNEDGVLFYSSK